METKKVLFINSKGGVGKSTLSSNLASYYASTGARTALWDFDRQMSGVRWLQRRGAAYPNIDSLAGTENWDADGYDWMVLDSPAGVARKELVSLVAKADAIIIPVLPSPLDIVAVADFVRDLLINGKIKVTRKPIAVVANRASPDTLIYDQLRCFLKSLKLPFAASIADSQNYIHASMQGIGVFEMDPQIVAHDVEQWRPLLKWIDQAACKTRMPRSKRRVISALPGRLTLKKSTLEAVS